MHPASHQVLGSLQQMGETCNRADYHDYEDRKCLPIVSGSGVHDSGRQQKARTVLKNVKTSIPVMLWDPRVSLLFDPYRSRRVANSDAVSFDYH